MVCTYNTHGILKNQIKSALNKKKKLIFMGRDVLGMVTSHRLHSYCMPAIYIPTSLK